MNKLPNWAIPSLTPAFYDFESATVLEQSAKMYAAMNAAIEEINKFVNTTNQELEQFSNEEEQKREEFECKITKVIREFQTRMNEKIDEATRTEVGLTENYDPESESLNITGGSNNG